MNSSVLSVRREAVPPSGYFTDDSMLRRVNRETVVGLAGMRSLLMQAAHPVAFAGFFEATTMLSEPYPRLERTARVLTAIGFGTKAEADAATRTGAPHPLQGPRDAEGTGRALPGRDAVARGRPRAAAVDHRHAGRLQPARLPALRPPASRDEQEAYWQDFRLMSKLFGLHYKDTPKDIDAFEAYMADMLASDDLDVGDKARELAIDIVMQPPVPLHLRPLLELANQITIGLLPANIRRMYGFRWDPVRGLAVRANAEYLRRFVIPVLPERLRIAPSVRAA